MEEGSLRCDANVSVRRAGETVLGTKTEVKNMNSFRNVERALEYEIHRQTRLLEDGGRVVQETLLWDADRDVALPMRSKEEAHDYRYFPDPDLGPVLVDERWIADVRASLPELPVPRRNRFVEQLGLPRYDADVLTAEKKVADYFESGVVALARIANADRRDSAKAVSNWVMTEVLRVIGEKQVPVDGFPVDPERLAAMIGLIRSGTISGKIAKEVFEEMLSSPDQPMAIVERKGLLQVSDSAAIGPVVTRVIERFPAQVQKYLDGNEKLFGFFVGEMMKETRGKANPGIVNELLKRTLASLKR